MTTTDENRRAVKNAITATAQNLVEEAGAPLGAVIDEMLLFCATHLAIYAGKDRAQEVFANYAEISARFNVENLPKGVTNIN
ncbi:hypothetical protein [Paracoccus onubensis]|uniref:Uncharacterized protein n=1 Tax=Paracoccus onubensis TaxID=1675788 RepID=A0A418SX15_9RHOB|nr:hypothetical protein [Paracoccus onubensis]RJE85451.1 hypothetical protein D3P04_10640 [Paracoccus onubensis]